MRAIFLRCAKDSQSEPHEKYANWTKGHAAHHGNELADQLAKEAATSREINECYKRIPKTAVLSELIEHSATKWQGEWNHTTKGAIMKSFFSKMADRLKLKINKTSNFKTRVTGHGSIKSYLHKYKIIAICASAKTENKQ
jgi:hypothetical protein